MRFRNPRGRRGENGVKVYQGRVKVTIAILTARVSKPRTNEVELSNCLRTNVTPTDRVAWRVVDKLNLRLWEWFCLEFWQVCKTLFPVGFPRLNSSLELVTTGKAHLLELPLKQLPSRMIFCWKPRSNLLLKESSGWTSLWIAAWMMLKWISCCLWPAWCWNQLQRRPNLDKLGSFLVPCIVYQSSGDEKAGCIQENLLHKLHCTRHSSSVCVRSYKRSLTA